MKQITDRVVDIITKIVNDPKQLQILKEDPHTFFTNLASTPQEQIALKALGATFNAVRKWAKAPSQKRVDFPQVSSTNISVTDKKDKIIKLIAITAISGTIASAS